MKDFLIFIDKNSSEILFIEVCVLTIVACVLLWIWISNKRKYQTLKHQIPAAVVKNYLDSIIHTSYSLKSSLFRGGGADVDVNDMSALFPAGAALAGGVDNSSAINEKNAQISELKESMTAKDQAVVDLQNKLNELQQNLTDSKKQSEELKSQVSAVDNAEDSERSKELESEVSNLKNDRDSLRAKLDEYAIIEDDLANLKRLQQENEQLKRALSSDDSSDGSEDETQEEQVAEASREAPEVAQSTPEESVEEPVKEETQTASTTEEAKLDMDKTPDDLLSEFEKMLG